MCSVPFYITCRLYRWYNFLKQKRTGLNSIPLFHHGMPPFPQQWRAIFFSFHGKLTTPVSQNCQLNKQITFIPLQLCWKPNNAAATPPPVDQHNWISLVNPADGTLLDKIGLWWGVKRVGEGWRLLGSSYSKKTIDLKCVLTVLHSWGPSRFQPICRGGGQPEVLPPEPELVVLKGQRLACVWTGSFWEQARGNGEELLAAACLLARSRSLPPGNGLPHHLSSGTTCCLCAWPQPRHGTKWFQESRRESGHNTKQKTVKCNMHHKASNPFTFRKIGKAHLLEGTTP